MKFGSVCSGIEAASVAWRPLGWRAQWFSEIEPFPCSALKHHYPETPNLGDMTQFESWPTDDQHAIDLLCGGTPCQSFSVAGLRAGLDDPRGNLMLTFGAIAAKYRPQWLVWENVPGVLSSNGGRDFGTFLGMLCQLGYGFAYRVLDAQYFGVAQRRRRVFVVGHFGDWRRAAAVLFERHSLQGHPAPGRQTGQGITHDVAPSITASGRGVERSGESRGQDPVVAVAGGLVPERARALTTSNQRIDAETETFVVAYRTAGDGAMAAHVYSGGMGGRVDAAAQGFAQPVGLQVRRLTPRECERLQGFPDDYTLIPHRGKPAADGPRYKALGNSWAVPNVRWIGQRIDLVNQIHTLPLQPHQPLTEMAAAA